MAIQPSHDELWPELPLAAWQPTYDTLHMWTQIVGKLRLSLAPHLNHWWQVPLYLSARGLTTSPIPYGERFFEIVFDLTGHNLFVHESSGRTKALPLVSRSVASFYDELQLALRALDLDTHIWPVPVEFPETIPFDEDQQHATYDPLWANRCFRVLLQADAALKEFSARFQGKQSPVHFFWGSFDLASTRFSGRPAPERPNADRINREAYSHEVMSFGFWPGTPGASDAAFYAYAVPEPPGFAAAQISPAQAAYSEPLHEFLLPYDQVRREAAPRERILEFCQSAYDAGASLGHWDRANLDRPPLPTLRGPGAEEHPPLHPGAGP